MEPDEVWIVETAYIAAQALKAIVFLVLMMSGRRWYASDFVWLLMIIGVAASFVGTLLEAVGAQGILLQPFAWGCFVVGLLIHVHQGGPRDRR
mgnify:CR=1 FL=1